MNCNACKVKRENNLLMQSLINLQENKTNPSALVLLDRSKMYKKLIKILVNKHSIVVKQRDSYKTKYLNTLKAYDAIKESKESWFIKLFKI